MSDQADGSGHWQALGPEVVGLGSDNGWLVSWGHSSVGVGHKLWDTGQWANVGAGSKGHSGGNGGNGSMGKSKGGHSRVGGELGAGNSGRSKNSLK